MADVYYSKHQDIFLENLKEVLKEKFKGCKKIAIKIHFGEPGNKTAFVPDDIKPITKILKDLKIDYFLFDSLVVYDSPRNNIKDHIKIAKEKGWDKLGEIVVSDDFVPSKGEHMTYEVCKPLAEADGVLVISHVKGHICSGFGGAIKNLGMGALTKKSKDDIHNGGKPIIGEGCISCKRCEDICPVNAIKVLNNKPKVSDWCVGCSLCSIACPLIVIKPKIAYFDELLADGANAAQSKFKRYYYISFLKNITQKCDCADDPGEIIANDCGFVHSEDAVSIDMASRDLIVRREGRDVFLINNNKSGTEQIESAEKFGMGSKEYRLIEI